MRGAAGDVGFYPVEMGEKVEQEVSLDHSCNKFVLLTKKAEKSVFFSFFPGKGGANAKGGNGGAGGAGGHGVQQIIIQKKSEKEKENSVTAEENVLGLGKESYRPDRQRQKKETHFPKLPITDFLI